VLEPQQFIQIGRRSFSGNLSLAVAIEKKLVSHP
jgi:hypothetical protein